MGIFSKKKAPASDTSSGSQTGIANPRDQHATLERLLQAIFLRGRDMSIDWGTIQRVTDAVHSADDTASFLLLCIEQKLRSGATTEALTACTLLDTLIQSCAPIREHAPSSHVRNMIFKCVTATPDAVVRSALAQLISNWATDLGPMGTAYQALQADLRQHNIVVPTPHHAPVFAANGFQRGMDFMASWKEVSQGGVRGGHSPSRQQAVDIYQQSMLFTADVKRLRQHIEATRAAFCSPGSSSELDALQQHMADVTEKAAAVEMWTNTVNEWLMGDLEESLVCSLIERTEEALALVDQARILKSAGIGQAGVPREDVEAVIGEMSALPEAERSEWASDFSKAQIRELQESNRALQEEMLELKQSHDAALKAKDSEREGQVNEVKATAVRRVRELMADVEDLRSQLERAIAAAAKREAPSGGTTEPAGADAATAQELQAVQDERDGLREELRKQKARLNELEIQQEEASAKAASAAAHTDAKLTEYEALLDKKERECARLRATSGKINEIKQRAENAERMLGHIKLELKKESMLRKKAQNQIREIKGNIRVLARIRPAQVGVNADNADAKVALNALDDFTAALQLQGRSGAQSEAAMEQRKYEFDQVFDQASTQDDVYAEVRDLVQSSQDGYNVCVFCYGQTGSGKTHTMTGADNASGIIPRAMHDIFDVREGSTVTVKVCMIELYQEKLLDLLGKEECKLQIKSDAKGSVYVDGAVYREASSPADLREIFETGLRGRKTASTRMNFTSSRSHLIFTMQSTIKDGGTGSVATSKLSFIDLAGSERVAKSGALDDKVRLDEARAINKSLSALGDVVSALTSGESFIPYRNHRLTEMMRDSLGGNAKTLMIVNVSPLPSDAAETKNSLEYASRVKEVTNLKSRNFETAEIAKLHSEIAKLRGVIEGSKKGQA